MSDRFGQRAGKCQGHFARGRSDERVFVVLCEVDQSCQRSGLIEAIHQVDQSQSDRLIPSVFGQLFCDRRAQVACIEFAGLGRERRKQIVVVFLKAIDQPVQRFHVFAVRHCSQAILTRGLVITCRTKLQHFASAGR